MSIFKSLVALVVVLCLLNQVQGEECINVFKHFSRELFQKSPNFPFQKKFKFLRFVMEKKGHLVWHAGAIL